ncbi:hypothetical protein B484DRAFT_478419 [Ochromonadaceae sp. CCMP2298]|nr:hypothetical protein B484DRAFT_478419 [Ochromonadaceae sp. CCMP2298]
MPAFESCLASAPLGFCQACCEVNSLAETDPEYLAALVAKSLSCANFLPSNAADKAHYNQIKALNFITRSYRGATPVPSFPQMAAALDTSSLLTRDAVEKVVVAIQQTETPSVGSLLSQISGKLSNLRWRVGVASSSSRCDLCHAYVLLSFDVRHIDQSVSQHSVELTYAQFTEFKAAFERVALAMNSL